MTYDPENWLTSLTRSLKEYAEVGFDSQLYVVTMEFPGTEANPLKPPFEKSLIHFASDDIIGMELGFGDNIFLENYDPINETVQPQEARQHNINYDVGIWTSDLSGGTTQRMRAFEILADLFQGSRARTNLWNATSAGDGGVEIIKFTGGRFITETIDDNVIYRLVDCEMEVRVFSRTKKGDPEPAVTDVIQAPGLTITS